MAEDMARGKMVYAELSQIGRVLALSSCMTGLLSAAAPAEPRRYRIDPEHTSVGFTAMHIGYARVLGQFLKIEGSFVFDETTRQLSELKVTIPTASVFTNHAARDDHLRKPEFLDSSTHPDATFVMTSAEPTGERTGKVNGNLTLRGVTKPITLDVTWNKSGLYPFGGNYVIGISAKTTIRRSDFGSTYAVENDWVGDEIPLTVELEAIREP